MIKGPVIIYGGGGGGGHQREEKCFCCHALYSASCLVCNHSRNFASVKYEEIFEGSESLFNTESVPSSISYKSFTT